MSGLVNKVKDTLNIGKCSDPEHHHPGTQRSQEYHRGILPRSFFMRKAFACAIVRALLLSLVVQKSLRYLGEYEGYLSSRTLRAAHVWYSKADLIIIIVPARRR